MKSFFIGLTLCVLLGLNAPASLLVNGGFETTDRAMVGLVNGYALSDLAPNRWDVYWVIPGWQSMSGSAGIEVQYTGVAAASNSGWHHVELDSHRNPSGPNNNSTMYQQVALGLGTYELSFWYQPRTGDAGDNGIKAYLYEAAGVWDPASYVIFANETTSSQSGWVRFAANVLVSTPGVHNVALSGVGTDNSLGGLIDDVSLVRIIQPNEVPEPATAGALAIGLAALAILRRRFV